MGEKIMRGVPALQRKLLYVVAAFLFSFLVYLLLTNNIHQMRQGKKLPDSQGESLGRFGVNGRSRDFHLKDKLKEKTDSAKHHGNLLGAIKEAANTSRENLQFNAGEKQKPLQPADREGLEDGDINMQQGKEPPQLDGKPHVKIPEKAPPLSSDSGPYSGPRNGYQQAIVEAFMHAWNGYKKYAWGHDELKPLSKGWKEWFGCGLTIVDSLDTMWIMGLKGEFALGRDWVANHLTFDKDIDVQLFEIVIRELGGLMSAYHLSNDKVFLDKAVELSDRLYPCLRGGPSKIPCNRINMKRRLPRYVETSTAEVGTVQLEFRAVTRATGEPKYEEALSSRLMPCLHGPKHIPCRYIHLGEKQKLDTVEFEEISTAEVGTIQLEFRAVSRAMNVTEYEKAVMDISEHVHRLEKLDGLVATFLNGQSGTFRMSSTVSMGASADSYYEYLLKQWIQTGKKIQWLRDDYLEAMDGMKKHLLRYTKPNKFAFVGALHSMMVHQGLRAEMEHLACFLPGTLALGYLHDIGGEDHLNMAKELGRTCYEMYHKMPTGLSPEIASMNLHGGSQQEDITVNYGASFNLQRPETVESLFYLYRATKDKKYRDWGWEIFQAFEKYTRVPGGYASVDNVRNPEHVGHRDKMETFYLAETLKYLYLLFSDDPDLLPLDKFVINTEAHPLPVYDH